MNKGSKTGKATAKKIRLCRNNSHPTGRLCMLRTLDGVEVAGKRILVRADFNVPITDGRVADDARIRGSVVTIDEILDRGGVPVVISHLGRPMGDRNVAFTLKILAEPLSQALGNVTVKFATDCIGPKAEAVVADAAPGEVVLLENLRFHAGETDNDPEFARALAALGDAYVGDAFSVAHRAHASIVGVPRLLPAVAGRLMESELRGLEERLSDPERPYLALLGGAKVSSKFGVLRTLAAYVDVMILGGGMANTFLAAEGASVGKSIREDDAVAEAKRIRMVAEDSGCEIVLPEDAVVACKLEPNVPRETLVLGKVPDDAMILDIGPKSVARIVEYVRAAKTVVWNGPLGAAEYDGFDEGTRRVAEAIANGTRQAELTSIVGGGDTRAALRRFGFLKHFSYASLAGGAFLEWLEGKDLPGVIALSGEQIDVSMAGQ